MDDNDLAESVKGLLARQEIHDTLMRYARGIDRKDIALVVSAFHPDAVDDHDNRRTLEQVVAGTANSVLEDMMHLVGNVLIEDLHEDHAFVESYFVSYSAIELDGKRQTRTRAGRYLDRFEKRDGSWKIAHRLVVDDWARTDPLQGTPLDIKALRGVRTQADAVFHMPELIGKGVLDAESK